MGFFNFIETVADSVNNAARVVRNVANVGNAIRNTLEDLSDPIALIRQNRSRNIPPGAVPAQRTASTGSFVNADSYKGDDWRVRLHIPAQPSSFASSPVLAPLKNSNNSMVFPTTMFADFVRAAKDTSRLV